ncbi:MAG: hypothetical protein ACLQPD_26190 [Desulfomonilaceae bacterium]
MEIDKDEPLKIYDDKGYYQFEKIGSTAGEIIVRAAYYTAQDKFDPVKTAEVPNRVLVEQFRLTVLNDLVDDKHGLSCVMEEILQSVIRKTFGPPRKKRKASRH